MSASSPRDARSDASLLADAFRSTVDGLESSELGLFAARRARILRDDGSDADEREGETS